MSESDETPTFALRFTPRARADIEAAHARFAELSGPDMADEWQAGLLDAAATLARTPHRALAPENARFAQDVRQLIYRRRRGSVAYRLLFVLVETPDDPPFVRILHVRHGSARPVTRTQARDIDADE